MEQFKKKKGKHKTQKPYVTRSQDGDPDFRKYKITRVVKEKAPNRSMYEAGVRTRGYSKAPARTRGTNRLTK